MKRSNLSLGAGVLAIAGLLLAGCGGGSGDAAATGTLPVASAPPAGTGAFSATSTAQTVALPASAGFTGTLSLPAATSGTGSTVNLFAGISPPTGTPIMQGSEINGQPAPIPLLYVAFTPSSNVAFGTAPSFSLTLPSNLPTTTHAFYVGYLNPANELAGYATGFEGPATVSGQNISFTAAQTLLSLSAGMTYSFAIYEIPLATPSPAPTP